VYPLKFGFRTGVHVFGQRWGDFERSQGRTSKACGIDNLFDFKAKIKRSRMFIPWKPCFYWVCCGTRQFKVVLKGLRDQVKLFFRTLLVHLNTGKSPGQGVVFVEIVISETSPSHSMASVKNGAPCRQPR
jgi:hypothetical protein